MKKLIVLLFLAMASCCTNCNNLPKEPWLNGKIPYVIEDGFTSREKEIIIESMNKWNNTTSCIRFIEATVDDKRANIYFVIKKSTKNSASIGYNPNGNNWVKLKAINYSTVLHELGHVIGLKHEHQRLDRDKYITIHWENIQNCEKHNYEKVDPDLYDSTKYEYDYKSIMHYSQLSFSKNGKQTYTLKDKSLDPPISWKPSKIDIMKVQDIYCK